MTEDNCIGIASDHAGYAMKIHLLNLLTSKGYKVNDYGNTTLQPQDDYPDYIIPLAKAIASNEISRGIAICGSGVGACITGNKVNGVRACLIHETFSAKQGVEDDHMNMICLGARVLDADQAWELTQTFLNATFSGAERHVRRLNKIKALETSQLHIL